MTDPALNSLFQARRAWRRGSLQPFGTLAMLAIPGALLAHQLLAWPSWLPGAVVAVLLLTLLADRDWRLPVAKIARKLDFRFPQLQDSAGLLIKPEEGLNALEQAQRQRVARALQQLMDGGQLAHFRAPWHRGSIATATGACLGLAVYLLAGSVVMAPADITDSTELADADTAGPISIEHAITRVQPPTYTGLESEQQTLQVQAQENSRVSWKVTLSAPAEALTMLAAAQSYAFASQGPLPSANWVLTRKVAQADFYQLAVRTEDREVLLPDIHNIEVTPDRAPEFTFRSPSESVTVMPSGEMHSQNSDDGRLRVRVTVADDFQVEATSLVMTLASGDGENIRFRNDTLPLQPVAVNGASLRYEFDLPIERYSIEPGDEIYWFLQARDNRQPAANTRKSQHFIVRWPQEEIFGLSDAEGMAIKVLPEYFRSQRQMIIDTESLLADREQITAEQFRARSESLAFEQNLLRMRYGRFLGEEDSALEHESESGPGHAGEEHSGHDDEHGENHGKNHEEHHGKHHAQEHGTAHPGAPAQLGSGSPRFGDADGVIASAGHQHDDSEHATLFDPATKELLRNALNAMWSSWRELATVEPAASLPYQHTALRYIKEVQQASRIYLQRVGFEPPPLDETRRLTGERDAVAPEPLQAYRHNEDQVQLESLLRALLGTEALNAEALAQMENLPQLQQQPELALELSKALRLYRQQKDCRECRTQLSALLYSLLPPPQAVPALPRVRRSRGQFDDWLAEENATGKTGSEVSDTVEAAP